MKFIVIALSSLFAFSCSTTSAVDYKDLNVEVAKERLGTLISYSEKCPSKMDLADLQSKDEESAGALVAPLVAVGADFIFKIFGKSLKAKTDNLNGQFAASGSMREPGLKSESCIVIARGLIGEYSDDLSSDSMPRKETLERLNLAYYPAFYLEMEVINNKGRQDNSSLILKPINLFYAASSAKDQGKGKKHMSLVMALAEKAPKDLKTIDEKNTTAIFRHDFGQIEIGKHYRLNTLTGTESSIVKGKDFENKAYHMMALVTESEEPGLALSAFSESYESKKGDLQKAFEDTIKAVLGGNKDDSK